MLSGTCNCDPFARTKGSFCGNLHKQSSFFDGFSASHSCSFHTSGYLVPNRRPFPYFFDNRVGYLCGIDCTSSWRGLDEWNEGERLDRQKRRVAPLEPGKVTIKEFLSNSQPTYAIHSRNITQRRLLTLGAGWVIHPASAGEERKQSWSSGIVIFHQEKGGRLVRRPTGSEPQSSALRSGPIFRTAPLLSLYKKSLWEARRAKPLMSWRRLYLRKSAKLRFRMCYILSIERQLLRKAFIPLWKKYKKKKIKKKYSEAKCSWMGS